jgi:hypothetical protein
LYNHIQLKLITESNASKGERQFDLSTHCKGGLIESFPVSNVHDICSEVVVYSHVLDVAQFPLLHRRLHLSERREWE